MCALIKQYKTVYLKLKSDLYHYPINLTKEHKKEIRKLIKALEKVQTDIKESNAMFDLSGSGFANRVGVGKGGL